MTSVAEWAQGARPKTLWIAVAPVIVGTATAATQGTVTWWRAAAALLVALCLQVGANYANDYADGVKGADTQRRGPLRLTASGIAAPASVRAAAIISFAVAAAAGLALSVVVDPWLVLLGVAAVAAAWLYSGGSRPYGYAGLGEVAVLAFFGFAATVGSAYVQHASVPSIAWWASLVVGLPACAVLAVNNLRDVDTDRAAGKRTLAVRVGRRATSRLYAALLLGGFFAVVPIAARRPPALAALAALPLAAPAVRSVWRCPEAPELVRDLVRTVRVEIAVAALLSLGLALS